MLIDLLIILVFLLASGFFSGIEIAFISADKLRIEVENQKQSRRGVILSNFLKTPSEFLGTTLVGNNIVLVILSLLASEFLLKYLGINSSEFVGTIQVTLITTLIVLVFGEFLPKVTFQINSTGILFFFAYPLYLIQWLIMPLVWVMIKSSNAVISLIFRIQPESSEKVFTRLDLEQFIDNINNTEIEDIDTTLFQNVLYINKLKVKDCMIPRNEISSIEINESIESLKAKFIETQLSRILVYNESIDYIIGYVHHQRLFENPRSIKEILWKIPMVHEFTPLQDVMNKLIKEKLNLAWVIDERGGTAGIVALEDILEEIFGEIEDEHDVEEPDIVINQNEFIFVGRHEIDSINEEYDLDIPESDEYQTLSGLIITKLEDIPQKDEVIHLDNYKFIILEVSNTKIEKIKVIKLED